MPIDFKKTEKELYQPTTSPSIIDVPELTFIMVDGCGNPNTSEEYKNAIEILYRLSYSIKMSKMSGAQHDGYFEYVVLPLEGLWWHKDGGVITDLSDKESFCWTAMIRQPEFVTADVFEAAKLALPKKKPGLDLSLARLAKFTEGLCSQVMHIGSYDDEPATIAALKAFTEKSGYKIDLSESRKHHEIYLNDPRKTALDKLKTVIRYPIIKQKGAAHDG